MKKILIALAALLLVGCTSTSVKELRDVTKPLRKADGEIFCSAVVISPRVALTAKHCVEAIDDGKSFTLDGLPVEPILSDRPKHQFDVAILRGNFGCPCASLHPGRPELDAPVIMVGFPGGFIKTVTHGTYQGILQTKEERMTLVTALAHGGNSGGPVFAYGLGQWRVIGIVSRGLASHLVLIQPVEDIKKELKKADLLEN